MTVTKPSPKDMPQETENKKITTMEMMDDALVSVFNRRLSENDPYLSGVVASNWDNAPGTPDELEEYVSEKGDSMYHDTKEQELSQAYKDLSPKKQKIWEIAEDNWGSGTHANSWTVKDIVDEGRGLTSNTVRPYVNELSDNTKDSPTPFEDTGEEERYGSKLYQVVESRHVTVTADGGRRWIVDWEGMINQLEEWQPDSDKDWYVEENWDEWMQFIEYNQQASEHMEELAYIQESQLDKPSRLERTRERWMKRARDELNELSDIFREIFYLIKNLSQEAYNSVIMWMSHNDKSESSLKPESNRPSARLDVSQSKIAAKQHTILQSWIRPLREKVPEHNTTVEDLHKHGDRVYEFLQSVGYWLLWIHSCCQDLVDLR